MTQKNFRAIDFQKSATTQAVRSKHDKVPDAAVEAPVAKPTSTPIVAPDAKEGDVPEGTVPEVLTWVGDDKDRAQKALDKENENAKPRKGLVSQLEEVISGDEEGNSNSDESVNSDDAE